MRCPRSSGAVKDAGQIGCAERGNITDERVPVIGLQGKCHAVYETEVQRLLRCTARGGHVIKDPKVFTHLQVTVVQRHPEEVMGTQPGDPLRIQPGCDRRHADEGRSEQLLQHRGDGRQMREQDAHGIVHGHHQEGAHRGVLYG